MSRARGGIKIPSKTIKLTVYGFCTAWHSEDKLNDSSGFMTLNCDTRAGIPAIGRRGTIPSPYRGFKKIRASDGLSRSRRLSHDK